MIKSKKYQIMPELWMVKSTESVRFHVQNNDYFGTIAAVIRLLGEKLEKEKPANYASLKKIMIEMENDLLLLQKNYKIISENEK